MTDGPIVERRKTAFQKHGESIVSGLILAILIGVGGLVFNMNDSMQTVLTELKIFKEKMAAVETRFDQYQTKEAARAAWEAQALRDEMMKVRVDQIQRDLSKESQQ